MRRRKVKYSIGALAWLPPVTPTTMRRTWLAIPLATSASRSRADRSSAVAGAQAQFRYRSATRTWAFGRGFQLRAQVGGEPAARGEFVEPAHGDYRGGRRHPVRLYLKVVVAHHERAARKVERAKRLHVLQPVVPPGRHLEHRLARRPAAATLAPRESRPAAAGYRRGPRCAALAPGRRACPPAPAVRRAPRRARPHERPQPPASGTSRTPPGGPGRRRAESESARRAPAGPRARARGRRGQARPSMPSAARIRPARRCRSARERGISGTPPAPALAWGPVR